MTPQTVLSTLALLQQTLKDLKPLAQAPRAEQDLQHYAIERQVQLCVDLSAAIAKRILLRLALSVPATNREIFLELGKSGEIPGPLAQKLAATVGLRNLIIHEYGVIDYDRFLGGLPEGYSTFEQFSVYALQWLNQAVAKP